MLERFDRYQEVKRVWRKKGDGYELIDGPFTEDWDGEKKRHVASEVFTEAINSGGCLFGAFDGDKMAGFAGVMGDFKGSGGQYLYLDTLHASREYRRMGIGKKLFSLCAGYAKQKGARKLYISAHPSEESQAFYRSVGCVYAGEIIPELFEKEPYDVHMEFVL
jgi:ribosomal protein S18 acetylase RimI-like enzyme